MDIQGSSPGARAGHSSVNIETKASPLIDLEITSGILRGKQFIIRWFTSKYSVFVETGMRCKHFFKKLVVNVLCFSGICNWRGSTQAILQ